MAPRYITAGRLHRDTLLLPTGQVHLGIPGGGVLYSAAGIGLWEQEAGILARCGPGEAEDWLPASRRLGLDTRGVHTTTDAEDTRRFIAYTAEFEPLTDNPVAQFARVGLPFPKELLDYREPQITLDSRSRLAWFSIRPSDIPGDYLDADAAHIGPMDYLSHSLLPSTLRQGHIAIITLDPSAGYMNPAFWDYVPSLLTGLSAFLTNEAKLRNLFQGRSSDIWEMMEALAAYSCDVVVVKRGERGQYLYDASARARYSLSAYPARVTDPTGAGDAFCGGFLSGYRRTYDPLQGLLYGNISASFAVEGSGPFYAMEALPSLAEARRQVLTDQIRRL